MKIRTGIQKTGKIIVLLVFCVFTVFPFIWMILSALKTKAEIMDVSAFFPAEFQWKNFSEVIFDSPLLKYVANSLYVSAFTLLIQIVTGAMIAYAIVFMKFKGKKVLFAVIMGTYMLPTAATYIPSYIILANGGLLNTYTGLIISGCVSIFGIFLLRQAFMQVPAGMIEAARIDGANHWQILWRVVCPMTKSSFITMGLMNFITCYNNYMWPSLITDDTRLSLVSQGLRQFFIEGGAYGTNWSLVMAGSAVIVIPLLTIPVLMVFPGQYELIKLAVLITASAPVGSNVAIFAQLYRLDYTQAVKEICISTLLCIITMPLIAGIGGCIF